MQTLPVPVALTADSEHFRRQREKYRERDKDTERGSHTWAWISWCTVTCMYQDVHGDVAVQAEERRGDE